MERLSNAFKITPPTRIDITSDESYVVFLGGLEMLKEKYDVKIEEPLPNAKLRGVYKVVFLDKHLLENKEVQWLKM